MDLLEMLSQLVLPLELLAALPADELPGLGVAHHVQLHLHLTTETLLTQLAAEPVEQIVKGFTNSTVIRYMHNIF